MTAFNFDPDKYQLLLAEKQQWLQTLLAPYTTAPLKCFASPQSHYRMRAEFRIWHEGEHCNYVMFAKSDKSQPVVIEDFPVASTTITTAMPRLLASVNANPVLKRKLYQVEFLSTLSGELLITLIYHRPLDEAWTTAARELEQQLCAHIIGRSRKEKIILSQDFIDEQLSVDGTPIQLRQPEGAFTQPNACVNQHMLGWAKQQAQTISQQQRGDLLELYCGIGNFTMVLGSCFNKVLATEMNKRAVAAAQHNQQINQLDNIAIARLSSEEITQAMNKVRPFKRLQDAGIELDSYQFSTLFVDPPRAGLDADTVMLGKQFDNILYISCNPQTLVNNLQELAATHTVKSAALFDQFPYTDHCEAGIWLQKNH